MVTDIKTELELWRVLCFAGSILVPINRVVRIPARMFDLEVTRLTGKKKCLGMGRAVTVTAQGIIGPVLILSRVVVVIGAIFFVPYLFGVPNLIGIRGTASISILPGKYNVRPLLTVVGQCHQFLNRIDPGIFIQGDLANWVVNIVLRQLIDGKGSLIDPQGTPVFAAAIGRRLGGLQILTVTGQVAVCFAADVDKDVKHIALILKSEGLCIVNIAGRLIFCEIHISAMHFRNADIVHRRIVVFIPADILDLHMTQPVFGSKAVGRMIEQSGGSFILHPVGAACVVVVVTVCGIPMVIGKPIFI